MKQLPDTYWSVVNRSRTKYSNPSVVIAASLPPHLNLSPSAPTSTPFDSSPFTLISPSNSPFGSLNVPLSLF
ncbi:UNVERIFIED_CONTAM: hypothetical protein RMT77_002495 [Armadillidium vulgare]